jgi:hypothetical protein
MWAVARVYIHNGIGKSLAAVWSLVNLALLVLMFVFGSQYISERYALLKTESLYNQTSTQEPALPAIAIEPSATDNSID